MDFFEVVQQRRSVRGFDGRPVSKENLNRILEAANAAPSAGNLQSYEIYVVEGVKDRSALARAAHAQGFVLAAPVSLVFCAHPGRAVDEYGQRGAGLYAIQDATIACAFAILAATALGLATVWTGAFEPEAVRGVLGASDRLIPVAILPIGYAAVKPEPSSRRPLDDLVHRV